MARNGARKTVVTAVSGAVVLASVTVIAAGHAAADADPFPGVGSNSRIWALQSISGNDVTTAPSQESNPINCPTGSRIAMEQWAARPGYWEMYCVKWWEPAPTPTVSGSASPTASPSDSPSSTDGLDVDSGASTTSGSRPVSSTRPVVVAAAPAAITDQGELDGEAETVDAELSVAANGAGWLVTVVTNSPETGFNITARKPGAKTITWRINSGETGATSFRTTRKLSGYMLRVRYQGETLDIASA